MNAMSLDVMLDHLARDEAAAVDLAELALRLAGDDYPDLDVDAYLGELTCMAREARGYLGGDLAGRVAGLSRYLFHEMGFRGNVREYYDPRNSYLNEVLDRRTGIPITLSVLAIAVGSRAGLHVEGVGLPGHFIAVAAAGDDRIFFDPFHGGRQLSASECENLVRQVTGTEFHISDEHLRPATPRQIAVRILTNLKGVYLRTEAFARAARVTHRLHRLVPEDPLQQRDLGVCLLRAGHAGKAVDPLRAYLATGPIGDDAEMVRRLLDQALDSVGEWN